LSARQLAKQAGVSYTAVSYAERGRAVTRDVLAGLVRVLGPAVKDAVAVWPPLPTGKTAVARARRLSGESRLHAANRAGVGYDVFKRAEDGEGVHPANAKKIADAFGLDVSDVLPLPHAREGSNDEAA
jgi:hypothetical protein